MGWGSQKGKKMPLFFSISLVTAQDTMVIINATSSTVTPLPPPPLQIVITGDSSINGSNLIVTSYNDYLARRAVKQKLLPNSAPAPPQKLFDRHGPTIKW